jgi:hypothetical protein
MNIKTSIAVAILAGSVAAASAVTYVVANVGVTVDCQAPASNASKAAPNIPTNDGARF